MLGKIKCVTNFLSDSDTTLIQYQTRSFQNFDRLQLSEKANVTEESRASESPTAGPGANKVAEVSFNMREG